MNSLILPDDHDVCIRAFLSEIEKLRQQDTKRSVLHIGAHMGEEVEGYLDFGYGPIYLVEANPEILPSLKAKFSNTTVRIFETAVGEADGTIEFVVHKTAKGGMESAGILPLDKLGQIVPIFNSETKHTVPMVTVDSLVLRENIDDIDVMVIDIQGAELQALNGARRLLNKVNFVVCEVNLISNYEGCALEPQIDAFFRDLGFVKQLAIYHELYDEKGRFPAWGECLWQR